jgi:methionyl-tRNA formyltransferase
MTQPDRPSGRGQKLTPPPVKTLALENGLPVRQPERLRKEPEMIEWLKGLAPDFLVTAAFGQILSQEVLDIPKYGTVNVHASLLPKYRGPNPIQWAILNNDPQTGVTLMLTELGVDTGPMLCHAATEIDPNEDAATLTHRLSELGAEILPQTLHQFASGELKPVFQDETQVSHSPKLQKEDAEIDWFQPAETIHNKIRGQQPWPGAVTQMADQTIKLYQSRSPVTWKPTTYFRKSAPPGEILEIIPEGVVVQTGTGPLLLEVLQSPGKPKTSAKDWANGVRSQRIELKFTGRSS